MQKNDRNRRGRRTASRGSYVNGVPYVDNTISVNKLDHPRDVSNFYHAMYNITQRSGYQYVYIDFSDTDTVFPNACVPVVAAMEHYKGMGIDIIEAGSCQFVDNSCILTPLDADLPTLSVTADPISKMWKFKDSDGVHALTSMYTESITEKLICEDGVLEGFEWCINEVMDNVLQHSQCSCGFVMVQVHIASSRVAVCISDDGIGIYNSLKHSKYKPRTHVDAITLAIKEGVTRDTAIGQGNGLWGLNNIIQYNDGRLVITSGGGSLFNTKGNINTFTNIPYIGDTALGTTVDFQITTTNTIDISKSLNYDHINLRVESHEDPSGNYLFSIKNESHGTGTRKAAIMVRNKIENLLKEIPGQLTLDFENVAVISSSYADELVGKLIVKYGFFNFQKLFNIDNMNNTVQGILNRSIAQRMGESVASKR